MITSLRARLLETDLDQLSLARATGINTARISEYASGSRQIPPHHLLVIARALEVAPHELVGTVELLLR